MFWRGHSRRSRKTYKNDPKSEPEMEQNRFFSEPGQGPRKDPPRDRFWSPRGSVLAFFWPSPFKVYSFHPETIGYIFPASTNKTKVFAGQGKDMNLPSPFYILEVCRVSSFSLWTFDLIQLKVNQFFVRLYRSRATMISDSMQRARIIASTTLTAWR